jgi:transcriptional regulator GlxA family with amidase domain
VATIVYTLLYIRRIKRQQHETLEKYLNLIEVSGERSQVSGERSQVSGERSEVSGEESQDSGESLEPMLQRVMQFVEENIANSDVNVGDMASAAAVSRSGLQRKVKQAMGITPQDLLREARIKRACQLLRQTDKTVAEVAYACGFSDPKYFSRSFKQSTGLSPTEYKTQA